MRRKRVYVDISVIGGVKDPEFADPSGRFFARVRRGDYRLLVSGITYGELEGAPVGVKNVFAELPAEALETVAINDEMEKLASAYIDAGALPRAAEYDALHVAAATVSGADLIVSWNFKHIVNYDRVQKFNAVNLLRGYKTLDIRSPLEVAYGDEDQSQREDV